MATIVGIIIIAIMLGIYESISHKKRAELIEKMYEQAKKDGMSETEAARYALDMYEKMKKLL